MKQGVQPLNVIIAILYLTTIALVIYVFKKANRPLKNVNLTVKKIETKQEAKRLNYSKMIAKSWLKKYTFVGSLLNQDKKYLLKQFLYLSSYAIASLKINKIILWPITFTLFLTPAICFCFEYVLKKVHKASIKQYIGQQSNKNAIKNQIQSELQIQQNIIEEPKIQSKVARHNKGINERTLVELMALAVLAFITIIMYFQTIYTLTNSVSNSAEINVVSLIIMFLIEQLAIRPALGLVTYAAFHIYSHFKQSQEELDETSWVNLLCQQQIADVVSQIEKQRIAKEKERLNQMVRKTENSPSKIKKHIGQSHEKSSYLNLIMQPTKREQPEQIIQQLFFTDMQKDLFQNENKDEDNASVETKRRKNKQRFNIVCHTAAVNKQRQDEEEDIDEISVVHQDILRVHNDNHIAEFDLDDKGSPVNYTKRKHFAYKKNKRVLHLTGSSPYLQYLPDMLKKVDKFKQMHQKQASNQVRKIL